jgi:DNA (cytosine-5)-methyltransferase 1
MYTYIDLFAGCGGLSDGFEASGKYEGLAHVEWEKIAAKTLEKRLQDKWSVKNTNEKVLVFDIQRVSELINGWNDPDFGSSKGLKYCLGKNKKIDVLIGGPPCQAYSIAGRARDENGMHDDYRNFLFESYIEVMKWAKPDIFVFENVVGILSAVPGGVSIIDRIHKSFSDAGYVTLSNLKEATFNLNEYGVPQKRSRVIIVGLRKNAFKENPTKLLESFYSSFRAKYFVKKQKTAKQALIGLPKFIPVTKVDPDNKKKSHQPFSTKVLNHYPRFHSVRDIETFRLLTEDLESGENQYVSAEALKELYTQRTGKVSAVHKYFVLRPNEPSNTIPAHLYKDGLRHIHWDSMQARSLTVREAARIQTFEDDFEFLGSMGDQYKMIGNAVPPEFAQKIAESLPDLLCKRS